MQDTNQILRQGAQLLLKTATGKSFFRCGVEKEGLRVNSQRTLAADSHPQCLGSPLTHDYFTTDYSENLLEFVTPVFESTSELQQELKKYHAWLYRCMNTGEVIWPGSMPCIIEKDEDVPIAEFGTSAQGMMRKVYRRGLGLRYGRKMQAIAGLHFNFSIKEDGLKAILLDRGEEFTQHNRSELYMGMLRNFLRRNWIVAYLFGASPGFDRSFLDEKSKSLKLSAVAKRSEQLPMGTSARLSDEGYTTSRQGIERISNNSLSEYIQGIYKAVTTADPRWEKEGLQNSSGQYHQLATTCLQAEFELYGLIRPKRAPEPNERPLVALKRRGIDYLEVRSLDLNPWAPMGLTEQEMDFMVLLLTHCLLLPSAEINDKEQACIEKSAGLLVKEGRTPGLKLPCALSGEFCLNTALNRVFDELATLAGELDQANDRQTYSAALAYMRLRLDDPSLLPSAKIAAEMEQGTDYVDLIYKLGMQHRALFEEHVLSAQDLQHFQQESEASLEKQKQLEAQSLDFAEYLQQYMQLDPEEFS